MSAYLIVRLEVTDPARVKEYAAATPPIIAQYGGKFLARGGHTVTLEGPIESRRVVVIEFPTLAAAEAYYHSPEYSEARQLRAGAAVAEFIAIEGMP